jgi:pimeloyl-ACP methyl ester carboxylesterase
MYSQPGALRCAFDVYRAFETDAEDNRQWLKKSGKSKVPVLALSGERSFIAKEAEGMVKEMYENVTNAVVEGTGHW